MKKMLFVLPLLLSVFCIESRAVQNSGEAQVDGLNGILNISANIVETPCKLSIESSHQEALLSSVSLRELRNTGDRSQPGELKFIFDNCMPGELLRNTHQNGSLSYVNGQPAIYIQLDSEHDIADKTLFRLHGDVSGVGLRIEGPESVQLIPGLKSQALNLNPGRNEFILSSFLEKTAAGPVHLGDFLARINVSVEYH